MHSHCAVCLYRCSLVPADKFPSSFWAWDLVDPLHLVSSYIVHPAGLLAVRLLMVAAAAASMAVAGLAGKTSTSPVQQNCLQQLT